MSKKIKLKHGKHAYLQSVGDILNSDYGLQHIGEWHSHHRLGLDHPSGHDAQTIRTMITIDPYNLQRFLGARTRL